MKLLEIRGVAAIAIFAILQGQAVAVVAAELPLLLAPATLSGKATTANFYGGVSSNNGQSYDLFFASSDSLDVLGEIQVEPAHVESSGNLYLIIGLGEEFLMRIEDGSYVVWDLNPSSLQPAFADKILQAAEPISIVENTALGPLGLAGQTLSIYLGYSVNTEPDELYFNSTPLSFSIARYDPLQVIADAQELLDTNVFDSNRNREIPVLIYLPEDSSPSPVLLFSHGLGGNRFAAVYLGEHWSDRGYTVVFMQHIGSDESILDVPLSQLLDALNAAANLENSIARIEDVGAVIDQLEIWHDDPLHSLYRRLDLDKIGMSGHSFGARTTQAVSGQILSTLTGETREPRISAALVLSPSITEFSDPAAEFAEVDIPWMLMTGTNDIAAVGNTTVEDRLAVFPALPPGGKYELVLFEGEHHAFTDGPLAATAIPRNPAHHAEIMALSTAFWDSWLLNDGSARLWLDQAGALSVLQPRDSWQLK